MSGQIFISYRREETRWSARSLCDRLSAHFDRNQIFMDVDNLAPGENFLKAIERTVSESDVLIAVIGAHWLTSKDEQGGRRLDNPEDFVRMEIATALRRDIRVVPVLVDGALIPRSTDLPDDLKQLVFRSALQVGETHFDDDCERLVTAIEQALEKTAKERREREQETKRRERERSARTKAKSRGASEGKEEQPRLRLLERLSFVAFVLVLLSFVLLPFQRETGSSNLEWTGAEYLCSTHIWLFWPSGTLGNVPLLSAFLCVIFLISSHFPKYRRKAILELVVAWVCFVSAATWILFPFEAIPYMRIGSYLVCASAAAAAVMKTFLFRYQRKSG